MKTTKNLKKEIDDLKKTISSLERNEYKMFRENTELKFKMAQLKDDTSIREKYIFNADHGYCIHKQNKKFYCTSCLLQNPPVETTLHKIGSVFRCPNELCSQVYEKYKPTEGDLLQSQQESFLKKVMKGDIGFFF